MDEIDKKILEAYDKSILIGEVSDKNIKDYKAGVYGMDTAFTGFSKLYMKSMEKIMSGRNEKTNSKEFKKAREKVADAYAMLDSAISKHSKLIR